MDDRLAAGRAVDDVAGDTDNGEPWKRGGRQPPLQTLAHRVLAGPVGVGQPLVDDGDVAVLALLVIGEGAAGDQRDPVRSEKIPLHPGDGQSLLHARPGRVLGGGRAPLAVGVERKIAGDRRGTDAWQRTQPFFERAIERSRPRGLVVAGEGQPHLRAQHVGRADAGCDRDEISEAADEESCADQQDERKGDAGDDQRPLHPVLPSSTGRARGALA